MLIVELLVSSLAASGRRQTILLWQLLVTNVPHLSMADGNTQDVRNTLHDLAEGLAAVLRHVDRAITEAAQDSVRLFGVHRRAPCTGSDYLGQAAAETLPSIAVVIAAEDSGVCVNRRVATAVLNY
jgi:hypothetical protein